MIHVAMREKVRDVSYAGHPVPSSSHGKHLEICARRAVNSMFSGEIQSSDLLVVSDEDSALKPLLQYYRATLLSLRLS